jgi:hypothetical protein
MSSGFMPLPLTAKIGDEHSSGKKFRSANEEFQHAPDRQLGAMYSATSPCLSLSLSRSKSGKKMIG